MTMSWVDIPEGCEFSLANLPYGVFSAGLSKPRIGVAIGSFVLDLHRLTEDGVFDDVGFDTSSLLAENLNDYASLGKGIHRQVRSRLHDILDEDTPVRHLLRDNEERREAALIPLGNIQMHMPMKIGDYTDFFVGLPHAELGAEMVRPGKTLKEVVPSFFGLPIAYHGRASSIVVSGTPFHRPKGQFQTGEGVQNGPTRKLDFEVEFACFIAEGNEPGVSIPVDKARDHIFGVVLMNDWSARDIQVWESTLMGPFGGKNFCTTISPWVVPLEALEEFQVEPKMPDRPLLPYLKQREAKSAFDIPIQVTLEADGERYTMATCNPSNVIFSFEQMIAQHTYGGCSLRTGDLIGTGTVSGAGPRERGCMLEATLGGKVAYELEGEFSGKKAKRIYLEDNDLIEFSACARSEDGRGDVGFGLCTGRVLPAI